MAEARFIPGYPGYRATRGGHILGKSGVPLKAQEHWRTGHLRVRLYGQHLSCRVVSRGEKQHRVKYQDVYVHVLIALAWIGEAPFAGALVRHLDGNPQNNDPENLRWGSRTQNELDKWYGAPELLPSLFEQADSVDDQGFDWATGAQTEALEPAPTCG